MAYSMQNGFSLMLSLHSRSHFAVDVQTTAPGGLVFYIGDKLGNRYMALYLSKGRYVFLLGADGRKIKIKTKGKYNDGQWHHVSIKAAWVQEFSQSIISLSSTKVCHCGLSVGFSSEGGRPGLLFASPTIFSCWSIWVFTKVILQLLWWEGGEAKSSAPSHSSCLCATWMDYPSP